jgi:hypothetical protein
MRLPSRVACLALSLLAACLARAESLLPAEPVPLDSLAAFRPVSANWQLAGGLGGDPRHDKNLTPAPGTGVLVNNPRAGAPNDALVTTWEHGDMDLDLDFLVPPGSNSGVYLQGRYEVQIFDSAGVKTPTFADCGGIYQRWDAARGAGQEGYEGHAPKANASRAPGLWQHLHIEFRAPRFDAAGAKVANARFVKVVLNGFLIHENVEVTGPTRSALFTDEKPTGPLLVQGDHGPVALRHLATKRYGAAVPGVKNLGVKYFSGTAYDLDHYADAQPTREAALARFPDAVTLADDRGVALVTGTFEAPVAGDYQFRPEIAGPVRLSVDGAVVVYPGVGSAQVGTVTLAAGAHALQLEYQHQGSWAVKAGGLRLWVEGPGIVEQQMLPGDAKVPPRQRTIPVEATDRVRLQRTFVPLPRSRRLYACFVGSPAGVHYAYDLESAALIGVWRGGFFEGRDLWHERAEDQEAHPAGPGFMIEGRPLLFQFGDHDVRWPDRPPPTSASTGYRLEADGQPVFLYTFSGVNAEDRLAALADGSGVTRTLKFSGKPREKDMWALLVESSALTPQPGGGYLVGDREYYIDWPKDSPVRPLVRREGDRVQLLVKVPVSGTREFTYNLVW